MAIPLSYRITLTHGGIRCPLDPPNPAPSRFTDSPWPLAWPDFRGARFDGSELHFCNIAEADLRGADLSKLEYGYASIEGTLDGFTKAPPRGCESKGTRLRCSN